MIELYHASMSVCSEKVRMALAEKGLEFKSHFMNLREGHQQTPDYIKLNPNAVVPTLVHDGNVIIESAVINEYIAEVFPGTPLTTSSPVSRARMRVWWKQLDESIHAFTGVISSALAFRYQMLQKPKEEIDASFAKMVDPVRRARMRDVMEKGTEFPTLCAGDTTFRQDARRHASEPRKRCLACRFGILAGRYRLRTLCDAARSSADVLDVEQQAKGR